MTERQAEQLLETLDALERGIIIVLVLGGILMLFVIADLVGAVLDWRRARHAPAPVLFNGEDYWATFAPPFPGTGRPELVWLDPSLPSPYPTEFEFVGKVEKGPDVRGVLKGGGLG